MRPTERRSGPATNGPAPENSTATKFDTDSTPFDDLGGRPSPSEPPHGRLCTPRCRELAVPSPLVRERPPAVACPWCGAAPGIACHLVADRRRPLRVFGRSHPSRLEAAA